jgi:hypothetical protein
MNNKGQNNYCVDFLPLASMEVDEMIEYDIFGALIMIKHICELNSLDVNNVNHIKKAVNKLKSSVSYN